MKATVLQRHYSVESVGLARGMWGARKHIAKCSISARRRSALAATGSDASIYAALCDLTLTRLGSRRINTRRASASRERGAHQPTSPREHGGATRRAIIDPVMELCYLEWRLSGAAVVREGRAFCRSAGDEQIILNSQETIGASM